MKKITVFVLFALLAVFLSGCIEQKEKVTLNESVNISAYEFEVFVGQGQGAVPVNTTTYYISDKLDEKRVVHMLVNRSMVEIIPTESTGGGASGQKPIENLVVLAEPANRTAPTKETFLEFAQRNETSKVNYTLTSQIELNQKVLKLEFKEPVTGFVAYTVKDPNPQNSIFVIPSSKYERVVLPKGYTTGSHILGIPSPEPESSYYDQKGRETFLWKDPKENEGIRVKYYAESAPKKIFIAFALLAFAALLVLMHYSRSKRELEKVRGILELEKEYNIRKPGKK